MPNFSKTLLVTAFLATSAITLTACDKKDAVKTTATTTASTTTTTNVTTTSSTANTTAPAVVPVSVASSPAVSTTPAVATTTQNIQNTQTSTADGKSIVTQAVTAGTPEATVKNAMDAMMNGTPAQAASFYKVDIADFDKVLAEQQPMVKQQLTHLELGKTEYNKDNTKAFIVGKLTTKQSPTPQTVSYKLVKVNGDWKLVE